jgi:hypothetical protein
MATTAMQKLKAVGATTTGTLVGALAGGPVGLGIGLVGGGIVDLLRAKYGFVPTPDVPTRAKLEEIRVTFKNPNITAQQAQDFITKMKAALTPPGK